MITLLKDRWIRVTILAICLLFATVYCLAGPFTQEEDRALRGLMFDTSYCAQSATKAMTRQGASDPSAIKGFALSTCGKPLYDYLVGRRHWESKDAGFVIINIIDDAYARVVGGF